MHIGRRIGILGVIAFCLLATSCSEGPLEIAEVKESEPGVLQMLTNQCVDDVEVEVTESADAVTVGLVEGRPLKDLKCKGIVWVDLDEPLGDRDVVVDGEMWIFDEALDVYTSPP